VVSRDFVLIYLGVVRNAITNSVECEHIEDAPFGCALLPIAGWSRSRINRRGISLVMRFLGVLLFGRRERKH
jgi:hypothetical protein